MSYLSQLTNIGALAPGQRRLLIILPPLVLGSLYLARQLYLLYKTPRISKVNGYDVYDLASRPTSLTTSPRDDSCEDSQLDSLGIRSAIAGHKCTTCRGQQKLSFREANVFETSFKNFSSGQLLKYGFEHLNVTMRAIEELKLKRSKYNKTIPTTSQEANQLSGEKSVSAEVHQVDTKLQQLFEELSRVTSEFEMIRNDLMPATFGSPAHLEYEETDGDAAGADDFDDVASYLSSATSTSLGYWDPEPNLHFFVIYQDALKRLDEIPKPKMDRSMACGCDSYEDFLAKVHCLREAFTRILSNNEYRDHYIKIGESILKVAMENSFRDLNECISAYYCLLDFVLNEANLSTIERETSARNIALVNFYDLVLDYMVLESYDDLNSPPGAIKAVLTNRWLSANFRQITLQTAVSSVLRHKRSNLLVRDGFFAHFYSILEHLSPVLAWGFLGTDDDLQYRCYSTKESIESVIRDYFSFDRCRYTSYEDLCSDIIRVTEERYWEMNNKLSIVNT